MGVWLRITVLTFVSMLSSRRNLALENVDVPPSVVPLPMLDLEPTAGQEAGAF